MDNDTKIINKITEIKADDVVNSSEYANSQKLHKKVFQILICISLVFYIPGIVFFTLFIYFFSIYLDYPSLILGIVFLSLAIIFSLLAYWHGIFAHFFKHWRHHHVDNQKYIKSKKLSRYHRQNDIYTI